MATSPSDPYKSRVVRGVVQQARRWLDRGQTAVRQLQVAASWSAQILLYPVYALFQTGRSVGKRIERSQQAVRLQELEPQREDIPLIQDDAKLTAESPLQKVLQTLQAFELPEDYVVCVDQPVTIRAIASLLDTSPFKVLFYLF
ncbi:MAG: hypothetical protein NW224_10115 [Leptolyngbyaceae cyanobacterium bins.302]|nr:hypothetical protein [Leptolyngbyaceae cyanobacterium bins.302]